MNVRPGPRNYVFNIIYVCVYALKELPLLKQTIFKHSLLMS